MASESALWKWIKKGGLPGKWERIHTRRIPDNICFYAGRQFFVELKEIAKWGKDGTVWITLTSSQIAFFHEWPGEKYIFAQVGKGRYWFKGNKLRVSRDDAINSPLW